MTTRGGAGCATRTRGGGVRSPAFRGTTPQGCVPSQRLAVHNTLASGGVKRRPLAERLRLTPVSRGSPPVAPGWVNVWLPCASAAAAAAAAETAHVRTTLSPHRLGPVEHGQPGVPPARSLARFMRFSVVRRAGLSLASFRAEQCAGFTGTASVAAAATPGTPCSRPTAPTLPRGRFVWTDRAGCVWLLGRVAARQFFCTFYERLVWTQPEFLDLRGRSATGAALQICGATAWPVAAASPDALGRAYLDAAAPFGAERTLYAMLLFSEPARWPWRAHQTFSF
jgi:hypothetical protein